MEDEEEKAGPLSGKIPGGCHLQEPASRRSRDSPCYFTVFVTVSRSNRRSTIVFRTMETRRFNRNNDLFHFLEEGTSRTVDEERIGIDLSTRGSLNFSRFHIFDVGRRDRGQ